MEAPAVFDCLQQVFEFRVRSDERNRGTSLDEWSDMFMSEMSFAPTFLLHRRLNVEDLDLWLPDRLSVISSETHSPSSSFPCLFGGYNPNSWSSTGGEFNRDPGCTGFLFSLDKGAIPVKCSPTTLKGRSKIIPPTVRHSGPEIFDFRASTRKVEIVALRRIH